MYAEIELINSEDIVLARRFIIGEEGRKKNKNQYVGRYNYIKEFHQFQCTFFIFLHHLQQ